MKKVINQIKSHILILLVASFIGLVALYLVHLLPIGPMKTNVYWSMNMIEKEFTDEILVDGYPATMTGNFTDCLMMHYAVYENGTRSTLEQVLGMYRSETYAGENDPDGWWPGQSLKDYLYGVQQPREVEYSRYWHGYLVVLKPILLLTSFNNIRLLNSAIQLLLVGYIILLFVKKKADSIAMAYLLSLPFMFYVSTYASLSLSICFYIMNLSVLIQLKRDEYLFSKNKYGIFFLLVGISTSYFDLLTYPIITLLYPLAIYFVFHMSTLVQNIKKVLIYSIEWGIGYVFMWASKWILTDIFTGINTINDAFGTIGMRTQSVDNVSRMEGFFNVIIFHIKPYTNWCYILLALILVVGIIVKVCNIKCVRFTQNLKNSIVFWIIALFPFVWLLVIQNHSVYHWQFTCRIIAATVFAVIVAIHTMLSGISKDSESIKI